MAEAAGAKVHFVGVGTPQQKDGYAADLTYVNAAVDGLLPYLAEGDIVAGKSTVRSAPPRGSPNGSRRPARRSCGTPSSCARAGP